jgi:AAA domain
MSGFSRRATKDDGEDPTVWVRMPKGPKPDGQKPNGPIPGSILTGAEFISRHVPPVWLIDGVVQRSRLYACTSLTGHGKTAVWLYNGCMIQTGREIGNLEVFQGNVLFLAGENPADLEARMIGMTRAYNLLPRDLPYVLPGSFPLTEDGVAMLKRDIASLEIPLALIVGDTASSFFPGDDENSNVQVGNYARTLRSLTECDGNPAVVVLSHPTKGADRRSLLPRGGGAFLNELDGNLTLWSESRGEVTELHYFGKIRGPEFSPIGYRLRPIPTDLRDERDRPEMTIVAEPMSEEAVSNQAKQAMANEDTVLKALRDHPGWSIAQIAESAHWVAEDGRPERWRVQRAMASLADSKMVEQKRKAGPWTITAKGLDALPKAAE